MRRYALLPIVVATASLRTAPPTAPPQRLFVAGLGYCGLRAARAFRAAYPACAIAGSARSEERAAALRRDHPWLDARVFDLDDAYRGLDGAGEAALGAATHVVCTMPPIADGDADPLLALHGLPDGCWAAYLSTTGVYGDHGGAWIDEAAELRGAGAREAARRRAEAAYVARGGVVLRLGGIYGPGRSLLDASRAAPTRRGAPGKPVNRVLVDDVCGALVALAAAGARGDVVNVVDDDPAPRADVVAFARELSGAGDAPPREPTVALRAARSAGAKRCRNAKLRAIYDLVAPTYREGLARIHSGVSA